MTTLFPESVISNLGGTSSTSPQSYFSTPESQAQLTAMARAWLRTPFHAHACIRGAGVDCVHLCAAIYLESGLLERFNPPKYTLDGGKHADKSLVTEWVTATGRFEPFLGHASLARVGDLLCLSFGKHIWHVGMMVGQHEFIHAVERLGVIESSLREHQWRERLALIYRPIGGTSSTSPNQIL